MASPSLVPLLVFLTATTHFPFASAQDTEISGNSFADCSNKNETLTSYIDDVKTLLASISSNITNSGFYSASFGAAHVIVLCRADIQLYTCRGCIDDMAKQIIRQCRNEVAEVVLWKDFCMVRYSNQPIFGKLAIEPHANDSSELAFSVQDPVVLARTKLIDDLRMEAANGGDLRKAAAGNRSINGTDVDNIYAMVQCTPDLLPEDCKSCSADAVRQTFECCSDMPWMILYKPSCVIRFDIKPFYNLTRLRESLRTPSSAPTHAGKDGGSNTTRNIIIIVVSIIVFIVAASCVGLYARKRMKQKKKEEPNRVQHVVGKDGDQVGKDEEQISSVESIQYDISKITAATDDFSIANRLGQGGFGTVYKGKLEDGREIAVKRLSENSCQGDIEFKNEVLLVARLQHRNLVRLLGFASEGTEKLLIYEFVQNGSLDSFVFDPLKSSNMDWNTRYKIIGGIAKGLQYIHEDSSIQIIHRDLKASNVLLDEKMNPKISDFGLARLVSPDVTQPVTKRIFGTYGYMAPEYASHGRFSIKSDVYSFGILVLEIVTGQRNENNSGDLISHAWRSWRVQKSKHLIDPGLVAKCGVEPEMLRCIHIALLCIQQNPEERPSIADVVLMLSNDSMSLRVPSEPAFYNPSSFTKALPSQEDSSSQALEPSAS